MCGLEKSSRTGVCVCKVGVGGGGGGGGGSYKVSIKN